MVDRPMAFARGIFCPCCEGTGDIGFGILDSSFKPNAPGKIGTDSRRQGTAGTMGVGGIDTGAGQFYQGICIFLV